MENKIIKFDELLYYWENEDARPQSQMWRSRLSPDESLLVAAWDKKFRDDYEKYRLAASKLKGD